MFCKTPRYICYISKRNEPTKCTNRQWTGLIINLTQTNKQGGHVFIHLNHSPNLNYTVHPFVNMLQITESKAEMLGDTQTLNSVWHESFTLLKTPNTYCEDNPLERKWERVEMSVCLCAGVPTAFEQQQKHFMFLRFNELIINHMCKTHTFERGVHRVRDRCERMRESRDREGISVRLITTATLWSAPISTSHTSYYS